MRQRRPRSQHVFSKPTSNAGRRALTSVRRQHQRLGTFVFFAASTGLGSAGISARDVLGSRSDYRQNAALAGSSGNMAGTPPLLPRARDFAVKRYTGRYLPWHDAYWAAGRPNAFMTAAYYRWLRLICQEGYCDVGTLNTRGTECHPLSRRGGWRLLTPAGPIIQAPGLNFAGEGLESGKWHLALLFDFMT